MRTFRLLRAPTLAVLSLLYVELSSSACVASSLWTQRSGGRATPGLEAAFLTSLCLIALVLTGCATLGVVLYRRSVAPPLPHHELIEELTTSHPEA